MIPVRLEHTNPDAGKFVLMEWSLGNKCTFACSYCPAILHDGSLPWQSYDAITTTIEQVVDHYEHVLIQYTGGEPTVHPRFRDILDFGREHGAVQVCITNGVRSVDWWTRTREKLDRVMMSFHHEFMGLEHFLNIAECIQETTELHVNILMLPDRFSELLDVANTIRALPNTTVQLKPLRVGFGDELYPYTDAQLTVLRHVRLNWNKNTEYLRNTMTMVHDNGTRIERVARSFAIEGDNHWKGWQCNVGLETLVVDIDGKVYRGRCKVGGSCGKVGEALELPTKPIICTVDTCNCLGDINTTKVRLDG